MSNSWSTSSEPDFVRVVWEKQCESAQARFCTRSCSKTPRQIPTPWEVARVFFAVVLWQHQNHRTGITKKTSKIIEFGSAIILCTIKKCSKQPSEFGNHVVFPWLVRGFFVCLEKKKKTLFGPFRGLFRGPHIGQMLRVLALEKSSEKQVSQNDCRTLSEGLHRIDSIFPPHDFSKSITWPSYTRERLERTLLELSYPHAPQHKARQNLQEGTKHLRIPLCTLFSIRTKCYPCQGLGIFRQGNGCWKIDRAFWNAAGFFPPSLRQPSWVLLPSIGDESITYYVLKS